MKFFYSYRIGSLIGVFLYITSLTMFRSHSHRPVLDLWSYPFFGIIVISGIIFLSIIIGVWCRQKKTPQPIKNSSSSSTFLDLGILAWGLAYLISAIDSSNNAGRVAELNVFGSITPAAVIFEWLAMGLLFIAGTVYLIPKLSNKWKNPVLLIVTVGVILILSEGAIRVRAIIAPIVQGLPTYTSLLWQRYHVDSNADGFRDIYHERVKPQGTRRILVVGDSYAFGWGVKDINDRFGEQLASNLENKTKGQWEVINASRGDTHTLQHIEFLERTLSYNPNIVILLYYFNDIDYLKPVTKRLDVFSSRFGLSSLFFKNFYIFQEGYMRWQNLKIYIGRESANNQISPYYDDEVLNQHIKDISKFVEIAKESNAKVFIVPFDIAIIADSMFVNRYHHFVSQAVEFGLPVLSIDTDYNGIEFKDLIVNKFDSHPNEQAHKITAEVAAELLLKKIDPPTDE